MLTSTPSRADALVAHVESLIEERGLTEGDRVANKNELRDQTGLSVATISEGIRLLQAKGRVTVRPGPGGGLFVADAHPLVRLGQSLLSVPNQPVTVEDSVIVRDALEPLIAAEAARYRDDDDVADLRSLLSRMADAVTMPDQFLRMNWRLHRRIAKICRNQVLRTVYIGLAGIIEDQASAVSHPGGPRAHEKYKRERLRIHTDYVDAIANGDVDAAFSAAQAHALHV